MENSLFCNSHLFFGTLRKKLKKTYERTGFKISLPILFCLRENSFSKNQTAYLHTQNYLEKPNPIFLS
ncbi:hypothetical protein LEP1GSC086_3092 [Leptospira weilii str. LNT 1234]|nr:hypothetical protein LEP1GSC086_3092 [Leptospira weilii str. LNT 1234]QDK24285.1 hypothetical protein FHG67_17395 [Leptospira weilii]QDK28245.1 hypothetical protein FHG68_17450 [Leptospira weilii]